MTAKSISFKPVPAKLPGAEQWVEDRAPPVVVVPTKRLTLDIPTDLHRRLKTHCAATGLNMVELCRSLIAKALPADAT